ncbi:MAG: N-acetylmuramoyl-L-alanine amidase [Cytophagales bacterium]|nr:N-acetylmuramoyl-L-alanine amidase [Cytophaga sp.]
MYAKTFSAFLLFSLCLCSFDIRNTKTVSLKKIVIDAGHGGKDPGCNGKTSREKDITLKIALQLGEMIKTNMPGVEVVYTRMDDRFIELHDRAAIANRANADLFVSIHVNAGPAQFTGTETYCMGLHVSEQNLQVAQRENSSILLESNRNENYGNFDPNKPESYIMFSLYQNANMSNSMILADYIENEFREHNLRHSRGVKQAGFLVLWKTTMPAVLVETGFLTHAEEEIYLNSDKGKISTAYGIYSAIEDYKALIESE